MMLYLFGSITTFSAIVAVMYFLKKETLFGTFFTLLFVNGICYIATQALPVDYYPIARIALMLSMASIGAFIIFLVMSASRNNN